MRRELDQIAGLFAYPGPDYHQRVRERRAANPGVEEFAAAIAQLPAASIEELYTRTFDLNPAASLDIGWHLFGEEYARGEFLVHLKREARRYGVPETTELPDHLTHVLPLLARMPEEEAADFEARFLLPALEKIAKTIADEGNPYSKLIAALEQMLTEKTSVET